MGPVRIGRVLTTALFDLSDPGLQYGGGVDYRINSGRAIRFEVRDVRREGGLVTSRYWTARRGLTFR